MKTDEIKAVLDAHRKWVYGEADGSRANLYGASLTGANLTGANLYGANLYGADLYGADLYGADLTRANLYGANLYGANLEGADLTGANLYGANLYGANLEGADLTGANLYGANLYGADLTRANLEGADLTGANLYGANLYGADLTRANLTGANLYGANLYGADLYGAKLPHFSIAPEAGGFTAFKKVQGANGRVVLQLMVTHDVPRTSSLVGRKCRAREVVVVAALDSTETEFTSIHDSKFKYRVGEVAVAPDYSDDIRQECVGGIHFFMTRREAEEY